MGGGGLMRGIKIPLQDFVLKSKGRGGAMPEGGVFAGHYSTTLPYSQPSDIINLISIF